MSYRQPTSVRPPFTQLSTADWLIPESGFDPVVANTQETLLTVGNGRIGTRGTLEEGHSGQLSGTYLSGIYDSHDAAVVDLVNVTDWLDFRVQVGGVALDVQGCRVIEHERALDLRQGCCGAVPCSRTPRDGRPGWSRSDSPAWPTATCAPCGSRSRH